MFAPIVVHSEVFVFRLGLGRLGNVYCRFGGESTESNGDSQKQQTRPDLQDWLCFRSLYSDGDRHTQQEKEITTRSGASF